MNSEQIKSLFRIRITILIFIICLVLSGLTAYPVLLELNLIIDLLNLDSSTTNTIGVWLLHVRAGLEETYSKYPWMAYGTDWLAFGHLAIAVFFIGAWLDPVKNIWIIKAGIIACIALIPHALITGTIRQIPFLWQLIDCSFGVFGWILLQYAINILKRLDKV